LAGNVRYKMEDFKSLLDEANKVFLANFKPDTWFGRCIFLSWYCDVGTCEFCFRSTIKHKIRHAPTAKRNIASILAEAIIGREQGWRLEFLTGGYRIFSFEELMDITKKVSLAYGEKIWINLGTMDEKQLTMLEPYIQGLCASIETVDEELHKRICPDKPIAPYSEMLKIAKKMGLKTSMTIVIGLGEKKEDITKLHDFITEHKLDRITFYALKPVKDTRFTSSPEPEYYAWWIAKTRIRFPKLEIMAGLTPKRPDYAELILSAGANAITKFPAVKEFGSDKARSIEEQAKKAGRKFKGSMTKIAETDWDKKVDALPFEEELKNRIKMKIMQEIEQMRTVKNKA
jgi:biotin synthase-like enzyme